MNLDEYRPYLVPIIVIVLMVLVMLWLGFRLPKCPPGEMSMNPRSGKLTHACRP